MQPYIKAMTWAFWRERRTFFALFIIVASAFSIFMHNFNPVFEKYEAMQVIKIFAAFIEFFSLTMLIIAGFGSSVMPLRMPDYLYVKPVSSRFLVMIYICLSILSLIIIHLITVLLYRYVGHLDWPVISSLICLTSLILCAYASFWSFSDAPFLCMTATTILCGFMCLFITEFVFKKQVSLQYFLINIMPYLLIIDIFALVICFKAIKNARFGERLHSAYFWERIYLRLKDLLPGKNWKLNTPQKAYFWLLFRGAGLVMADINLFFVFIAILLFIFVPEPEKSQEVLGCTKIAAFINLFMFPFIGALMAHQQDKSFGVSYQIATRPISESSIIVTILKVFTTSYIIGWAVFFIGLAIVIVLLSVTGRLNSSDNSINELQYIKSFFSLPNIMLFPLGIWAAAGLLASTLLSGRKWLVLSFFSTLFTLPIIAMLINTFGSETINHILKFLLIWLFALGSVSGTILAMIYAIRRYLITSSFVGLLIGAYISFCIIGLILNFSVVNNPANAVILCGMLALPFAPFATAPLALYWNRHR